MSSRALAWCCALAGALWLASAPSLAAVPAVSGGDLAILISAPESAPALDAAARLRQAAESGNSFAMYDLGSLSRQHERKRDSALGYDPGLALKWLLQAFRNGRDLAAYKLALTYREIGDTLEAMAWIQVYSHYNIGPKTKSDGAAASLMASLYDELGEDPHEAIRQRTISLLQQHGPQHEAASKRGIDAASLGDIALMDENCRWPKKLPRGLWQRGRIRESAYVEALVRIDDAGKPSEVHLMDYARRALHPATTRDLVLRYRCPIAADGQPYWMFINMSLDDRRHSIATD
jgi:hypothetical protein